MKELIIIFIIIVIIVSADIYIGKYLKNSSQKIIGDLNNLKETINKIGTKTNNNNNNDLTKLSNEIYDNWKKTEEKWAMLVLHSELDQIEIALIKMKTQIKENNLDMGLEELETSLFLIDHINTKEKFCLKNVF